MKTGRIMGVLLSILVVLLLVDYYVDGDSVNTNSFELLGDAGVIYDHTATYDNVSLGNENKESINKIKFTNTRSYPVTLSESSINIKCNGSGQYKNDDEYLVFKNMKIKTSFADSNDGIKHESLTVEAGDNAYVFVNSSYTSEELPKNEVVCDYEIALQAS